MFQFLIVIIVNYYASLYMYIYCLRLGSDKLLQVFFCFSAYRNLIFCTSLEVLKQDLHMLVCTYIFSTAYYFVYIYGALFFDIFVSILSCSSPYYSPYFSRFYIIDTFFFLAPHQPRLDWQMWFASLGTYDRNPWFLSLLHKLLLGKSQVLGLLDNGYFEHETPQFIKVDLYRYHFTKNTTSFWNALSQTRYVCSW